MYGIKPSDFSEEFRQELEESARIWRELGEMAFSNITWSNEPIVYDRKTYGSP